MKHLGRWASAVFLIAFWTTLLSPADARAARAALVIGNGAYQYIGKLDNPVNDATAMAATLTRLGFQVTTVTDASQQEGEIWREPKTGMEFVWLEGGCFDMGTPPNEAGYNGYDDGPVHRVCVDGFWMGKTEVANAQYRKWKPEHTSKEYNGYSLNGDDQPAVYVSWHDAKAFTAWLNQKNPPLPPSTSSGQALPGGEFRLPTEAEWEYAVRAGTRTSRYWGENPNDACQYANVDDKTARKTFPNGDDKTARNPFPYWGGHPHQCEDGSAVTAPVGSFQPNKFGLHDMLGNVWEWCEDSYDAKYYATSPSKNPQGPASNSLRLLRGGSWNDSPPEVRSAARNCMHSTGRNDTVGFRVVVGARTLPNL